MVFDNIIKRKEENELMVIVEIRMHQIFHKNIGINPKSVKNYPN